MDNNNNENLKKGYIKLYRSLLDWEWYDDKNVCRLFTHCLLRANHADRTWHGQIIRRGSFITSYEKLSTETSLTVREIRTALNKLKMTNELTCKSTSRNTTIIINNFNFYQPNDIQNDLQSDNETTNERQTNDNKQELKELKNHINHQETQKVDEKIKKSLKKKIKIEDVPDSIKNNPSINNPCAYWAAISEEDRQQILQEEERIKNWEKEVDEAAARYEERKKNEIK